MNAAGTLHGVGLGPGDPELLTVKAVRTLEHAPVVAYFAKAGRCGYARSIAARWMPQSCIELPLHYPVTAEIPFDHPGLCRAARGLLCRAHRTRLAAHLEAGRDVALLCEGDPFFYGSFMHLYIRLRRASPAASCPASPACRAAGPPPESP